MGNIIGGLGGALRSLLFGILVLIALCLPLVLAWWGAGEMLSRFQVNWWMTFGGIIALEILLGIFVLFGIASGVQESHSRAVDQKTD